MTRYYIVLDPAGLDRLHGCLILTRNSGNNNPAGSLLRRNKSVKCVPCRCGIFQEWIKMVLWTTTMIVTKLMFKRPCDKFVQTSSQLCHQGDDSPLWLLQRSRLFLCRLRSLPQLGFKGEHPRLQLIFLLSFISLKLSSILILLDDIISSKIWHTDSSAQTGIG